MGGVHVVADAVAGVASTSSTAGIHEATWASGWASRAVTGRSSWTRAARRAGRWSWLPGTITTRRAAPAPRPAPEEPAGPRRARRSSGAWRSSRTSPSSTSWSAPASSGISWRARAWLRSTSFTAARRGAGRRSRAVSTTRHLGREPRVASLRGRVNSLFCRHNRFTADCPICSKGTVLDPSRPATAAALRRPSGGGSGAARAAKRARGARHAGPYASAGPYEDEAGESYEVRLERVPGGRAAGRVGGRPDPAQRAGAGRRRPARRCWRPAASAALLGEADAESLIAAVHRARRAARRRTAPAAAAPGDMQEELRVERLEDGRVRIARWILRPGAGWELQEAPVMLPAEALRRGPPRGRRARACSASRRSSPWRTTSRRAAADS